MNLNQYWIFNIMFSTTSAMSQYAPMALGFNDFVKYITTGSFLLQMQWSWPFITNRLAKFSSFSTMQLQFMPIIMWW